MIVPDEIDIAFLNRFKTTIEHHVSHTTDRVIITTGGGSVCRRYNRAAVAISQASHENQDWIGIASTRLNAELLRVMFYPRSHAKVIQDPTIRVQSSKRILIGAGWKPGHSSDMAAVEIARVYGATTIINLSNISHVYSADPRIHQEAKPIDDLTWNNYLKLVPKVWVPGLNTPFDPVASQKARRYQLSVLILSDPSCKQLVSALANKTFIGSRIHP